MKGKIEAGLLGLKWRGWGTWRIQLEDHGGGRFWKEAKGRL